ncbi:hypothetical protein SLEP1_g39466 [Rubroshorea leprosula]|uniref:Uncharacterized protein n=1 Tax=Rubroshorea leprosula TaxID=152421 RepID=A0AAV5L0N8_9ROSI|nr:hypothetical protein SLEP1_g39466 [Rubroshorea leprosula]
MISSPISISLHTRQLQFWLLEKFYTWLEFSILRI